MGHTVPTVTNMIYFHAGVLPATSYWAGRWEYKVHMCIEPLVALTQVYVLHNHMSIAQACHYNSLYIPFSDERAMKRVVPQLFQDNTELYEKVVEVSAQL